MYFTQGLPKKEKLCPNIIESMVFDDVIFDDTHCNQMMIPM
jgi:hypothetical protein